MAQLHGSVDVAKKKDPAKEDQDAQVKGSLQKIKNKFIVMSGKGGV